MQEITKIPLVILLQNITKKEVARKGDKFVYLTTKQEVEQEYINQAEQKQDELYFEEVKKQMDKAIQNMLDSKAQELRYDNMMSARSYAGYDNPFKDEAVRLATWCANCWAKAGEIEADVEAGNRPMPTVEEVLSELPAYQG